MEDEISRQKQKLKPCPFCGGEADIFFTKHGSKWKVRCKNISCGIRPTTEWLTEKEEAIEKWNKRTEPPATVGIDKQKLIEEVERLRTAYNFSACAVIGKENCEGSCSNCILDSLEEFINSQPPADQPEPKRGKWIRYEDTHENSVKYICPFCGDYTAFRGEIAESTVNGNYIYCRHCGAKNGEDQ